MRATVTAHSPNGSVFDGGSDGTDLPVTVSIPPFGQATVDIRDNSATKNTNHIGSVIIEADGLVLPDGQIMMTDYKADTYNVEITIRDNKRESQLLRSMTWYPDHSFTNGK